MGNQKYENIIYTLFDEVFTKGNLKKCKEIFSERLQFHDVAMDKAFQGLAGYEEVEGLFQKAFPGKLARIDQLFSADDKVVVRWRCTGTHKGEFNGISPTNKKVDITGISIYRFSKEQIVEVWQSWDRLGLYEQIGEIRGAHALHH